MKRHPQRTSTRRERQKRRMESLIASTHLPREIIIGANHTPKNKTIVERQGKVK